MTRLPKSLQDTILGWYRCGWPPKVRMGGLLTNKPEKCRQKQKVATKTTIIFTVLCSFRVLFRNPIFKNMD